MTPTGNVTLLNTFATPFGFGLIRATDGNLYGTSSRGGLGFGTIVRVASTGVVTTVYTFQGGYGGEEPGSLLQASDGNFYGALGKTNPNPYDQYDGGIFRMTPNGTVTILVSHELPARLMQAADGSLYGINSRGIFRMSLDGALTFLAFFPYTNEGFFPHSLVQASDGNFYGTTTDSSSPPYGSNVFRMTPQGVVTILHTFPRNLPEGIFDVVWSGLTLGPDGNLYGIAELGGAFGRGEVFRITPSTGLYTGVHSFTGWLDGGNPTNSVPLTLGADGSCPAPRGMGEPTIKARSSGRPSTAQ